MADATPPVVPPVVPPVTPPVVPPVVVKPTPTDEQKKARKAARKELKAMLAVDRQSPTHNPKSFDDRRFHALHYLAKGLEVPSIDPDDLDD